MLKQFFSQLDRFRVDRLDLTSPSRINSVDVLRGFDSTLFLMLLYWAIIALVPVPGVGAGMITPEGNFAIYFDRLPIFIKI